MATYEVSKEEEILACLHSLFEPEKGSPLQWYMSRTLHTFLGVIAFVFLLAFLAALEQLLWVIALISSVFLAAIIWAIISACQMRRLVANPLNGYSQTALADLKLSNDAKRELSKFEVPALESVQKRLELDATALAKALPWLIGDIPKLGFLPALLATVVLFVKAWPNHESSWFAIGMFALVGVYFGGFLQARKMMALESSCRLISSVIEAKKARAQFHGEPVESLTTPQSAASV